MSICCFCIRQVEFSSHIFFECRVTSTLWEWLCKGTDIHLDSSNCLNLLMNYAGRGSKLVQHVINSAIIHTIWVIWIERNQRCFHDKHKSLTTLFNCVLAEVKLSYNLILAKGNSNMQDYKISRLFNIPLQTKRIIIKQEVHWSPPPPDVVKINCDGSSIGPHPCGAIDIVFGDSRSNFLGAISSNIGHATALEAEFSDCLLAIEKAMEMQLPIICLETDSIHVANAFHTNIGVPWKMRARWLNCLIYCNNINCSCVQVLREQNQVADALAKNG